MRKKPTLESLAQEYARACDDHLSAVAAMNDLRDQSMKASEAVTRTHKAALQAEARLSEHARKRGAGC